MKFYTNSFHYDDPWAIVTLAYFLRYPNPYATHILSCDVISRNVTPAGHLLTTRLILKKGQLPRWAPKGIISRTESWVIEESEVDPLGKTVRCTTKNLEFTKVMKLEESVYFQRTPEGRTQQTTEARVISGFGWGLTKRIEAHGLSKFKAHMQRSREGISLILSLLRERGLQPMTLGPPSTLAMHDSAAVTYSEPSPKPNTTWGKVKTWFYPPTGN